MQQHTLLIASADETQRTFVAAQLDADGHTVYEADSVAGTVAKLSVHAVDVVVLGDLVRPADSPALLRAIRADAHTHIHPGQPVITLGGGDEISALRAYDAGSDHHLAASTGYVLLRAVLLTVARRVLHDVTSRHVQVGTLHIDTGAQRVQKRVAAAPAIGDRVRRAGLGEAAAQAADLALDGAAGRRGRAAPHGAGELVAREDLGGV